MNAEAHLEIERKYDVPAEACLPELRDIPGCASVQTVVEHLDATYFDTSDLRLLEGRGVLRRREGGHDAGWHVKLRARSGRRELRWPLGDPMDGVPGEVRAALAERIGTRELTPLARVQTTRTATTLLSETGAPLAELSDDRVEATDLRTGTRRIWREWEAEASESLGADGASQVLDACETVLRRGGAVPSSAVSKLARAIGTSPLPAGSIQRFPTAGAVLAASLRRTIGELLDSEQGIRTAADDAVHRARVRVRTLRTLLDVYGPLCIPHAAAKLSEGLRRYGRALGRARDAEVHAQFLRDRLAELPLDAPAQALSEHLAADTGSAPAARELRRLWNELDRPRHTRLRQALREALGTPPLGALAAHPPKEALIPCVREAARSLLQADERARAAPAMHLETLHEVRKAARRLRYAAEALRGSGVLSPETLRALVAGSKAVQTHLGDHRDETLLATRARAAARRASGREQAVWAQLADHCEDLAGEALTAAHTALAQLRTRAHGVARG
ncbi:MAG: CYTH and CHAD domain-containing protein [Microbacteriaceae bacterium]|jgi:CHAD domain-containing protein|nr:CYTH and CHAD domain-containing protein [Microbacteriaceae bacterium]MCI1207020.1 CYTH and CHAD domain-containing protein [Microbacteriaceae bacterium]